MNAMTPGTGAVLLVDDDESLLSAMTRVLRPDGIRVFTATSAERALACLEAEGESIGAVVSDYAMPGTNGADLLRSVRMRWPDAARVLATGNADLAGAARAVNEGQVARLILKPWEPDRFRELVMDMLEQHRVLLEHRRLQKLAEEQAARLEQQAARLEQWNQRLETMVAERTAELERANASLQRGLLDTVRLLLGFLERRTPERAARCREIARLAGRLAERAGLAPEVVRRIQVAALVHDIGLMGLADPILRQDPDMLTPAARLQYEQHPVTGQSMLSSVDQLVEIGTWIRHHHERWDGRGYPDRLSGVSIPMASRLIALADGYLDAVGREGGTAPRWRSAQRAAGAYDPDLLEVLTDEIEKRPVAAQARSQQQQQQEVEVALATLRPGMQLMEPLVNASGAPLLRAGDVLNGELITRIQALAAAGVITAERVSVVAAPTTGGA